MTTSRAISPTLLVGLQQWRAAAEERGYAFQERMDAPQLSGMLFREGDRVVATHVVNALGTDRPFVAGSLEARYAAADDNVATSFVAIPLARSLPSIMLVNAHRGALRQAGIGMGTRQMLRLEGDFDRAFTLYCALGSSEVALSVFTPELMRLFLQETPGSDIEIAGDWMFIYGAQDVCSSSTMLDAIERVAQRVHETVVVRSFEPVAVVPATQPAKRRPTTIDCIAQLVIVIGASLLVGAMLAFWGAPVR